MAESSLSIGYPELVRAVGRFLGYGPTSGDWESGQLDEVKDHIASGLRRFYGAHKWSFMRPYATLSLVSGTAAYDLADNFSAVVGDITYAAASLKAWTIQLTSDLIVRKYRQTSPRSGTPEIAAIHPKTADGTTGQRYEIVFYPTPDAAATVTFQQQILPETVTADAPYPLGGERYAEVIMECCLAAAEKTMDDGAGIHASAAVEELALAIKADNEHRSVHTLGYNHDTSEEPTLHRFRRSTGVTYNGVSY